MRKVILAMGFAVGYVLGTRAGRQRYEQIARMARRVMDHPTVQSTAGILGAQATDLAGRARGKAMGALHLGHEQPQPVRSTVNGSMP
jgi:hypothetical protein